MRYELSEGGDMSHLKAVMCHLKVVHSESTQKALRDLESNQTLSYSRSLKYFVLFLNETTIYSTIIK